MLSRTVFRQPNSAMVDIFQIVPYRSDRGVVPLNSAYQVLITSVRCHLPDILLNLRTFWVTWRVSVVTVAVVTKRSVFSDSPAPTFYKLSRVLFSISRTVLQLFAIFVYIWIFLSRGNFTSFVGTGPQKQPVSTVGRSCPRKPSSVTGISDGGTLDLITGPSQMHCLTGSGLQSPKTLLNIHSQGANKNHTIRWD